MKLAILETGRPPAGLQQEFGRYPEMLRRMLGESHDPAVFDVENGKLPRDAADFEAYIITGSPAGIYDPLPWIAPLLEFIRGAAGAKMVGICFGHQAMAEALGGKVEKSDRGWGVGLHRYRVTRHARWMDGALEIAVPASHQDQVVVQPPRTQVIAASDFTPIAALEWADRPAISFQFHPEFAPEFAAALIDQRRDRLPDADAAIASLSQPNDSRRVGEWIRRFLES